jgi:hypothetical protein
MKIYLPRSTNKFAKVLKKIYLCFSESPQVVNITPVKLDLSNGRSQMTKTGWAWMVIVDRGFLKLRMKTKKTQPCVSII